MEAWERERHGGIRERRMARGKRKCKRRMKKGSRKQKGKGTEEARGRKWEGKMAWMRTL